MPYRNKTFVSFDGDADISYYHLMRAWTQRDGIAFNFYDAHDLNTARDTSQEDSIKAQLSVRIRSAKVFVLLVGERARYLHKFVRWEIQQAINRDLPIIAVNLNGKRSLDEDRCPPVLRPELAVHVSFNAAIVQYSLDYWPSAHVAYRRQSTSGPYYYNRQVYSSLGL